MRVAWKSDRGRRKSVNEDSVLIDEESRLFLLADGMSSPCAGDIASGIAVQYAHSFMKGRIEDATSEEDILNLMQQAVIHAHEAVQNASKKNRAYRGMGTTLMVLFIKSDTAFLTHVGDSRAYRISQGLELITTDHTLENQMQHEGMLRELFFFHKARVLAQAVGPSRKLACDGHRVSFRQGDYLLLCSDGLTDMLSDETIQQIITLHGPSIDRTAESLIEAANRMGGRDNISVVVITP
jgi:serine/threonine protein phosphatase PrpC